jgi:hypothetical protein
MGPFCGLVKGRRTFSVGLSRSLRMAPSKASLVVTTTRSPGRTRSTGSE